MNATRLDHIAILIGYNQAKYIPPHVRRYTPGSSKTITMSIYGGTDLLDIAKRRLDKSSSCFLQRSGTLDVFMAHCYTFERVSYICASRLNLLSQEGSNLNTTLSRGLCGNEVI
jgi:hypothetical protein